MPIGPVGSCGPGLVVPGVREGAVTLGRLWRDYRALVVGSTTAETEELPSAYDFSMQPDQSVITTDAS